jgi:hypothetical protein
MPSTGFTGIYKLDATTIDKAITRTSAGAYVLTREVIGNDIPFTVNYAGRSDTDLKARLKQWAAKPGSYTHFKAGYCDSPKEAFEKECGLYHDFGESKLLDNSIHPQRPANASWKCPRCKIFG